ncbi:hypothetical protein Ancab_012545 [Ancistrocladus abbreviatus]
MAMSMLMSTLLNSATLASASTSAFCMQKKFLEQLRHQFSFSSTFLTKASFFSLFSTPKHFSSRPAITATAETTTRVTADDFSGSAGFLGIGIMGSPMVENLIQAGYVDVSTVDSTRSKLVSSHIKAIGALFLEAPVLGSKKPAEDGQLIFLIVTRHCMTKWVPFQTSCESMMASFAEGLLLSKTTGLDPSVLVEVYLIG